MSNQQRRMSYWGVKFEKYMTQTFSSENIDYCEMQSKSPKEVECYYSVLTREISKDFSVLFNAEINCCKSDGMFRAPKGYVELKTSRHIQTNNQYKKFVRKKALKWWAQSYLSGVPQITCEFCDDYGFVNEKKDYTNIGLPDMDRKFN